MKVACFWLHLTLVKIGKIGIVYFVMSRSLIRCFMAGNYVVCNTPFLVLRCSLVFLYV